VFTGAGCGTMIVARKEGAEAEAQAAQESFAVPAADASS
jgi:hypothetical protein